jgi:hypothetical protein
MPPKLPQPNQMRSMSCRLSNEQLSNPPSSEGAEPHYHNGISSSSISSAAIASRRATLLAESLGLSLAASFRSTSSRIEPSAAWETTYCGTSQ